MQKVCIGLENSLFHIMPLMTPRTWCQAEGSTDLNDLRHGGAWLLIRGRSMQVELWVASPEPP
jgi:hypothetical protein